MLILITNNNNIDMFRRKKKQHLEIFEFHKKETLFLTSFVIFTFCAFRFLKLIQLIKMYNLLAKFKRASRVLSCFLGYGHFHFSNDLVFISLNNKMIIHIF